MMGGYVASAGQMGQLTARMHRALASLGDAPAFAPEPISRLVYKWYDMTIVMTLTPEDGGVLLRMEQSGFANDQAYNGAKFGWTNFLARLEQSLVKT